MKQRSDILRNVLICILLLSVVKSFPISVPDSEGKPDVKEEMRFPNGTVVGKYAYLDNEGNPIQVKYYADESSYGVELNSVKVVNDNSETGKYQNKKLDNVLKTSDPLFDATSSILDSFKYPTTNKYKTNDPMKLLNKDATKHHKTNPDYEIYLQTDLSAPKKCNKEKIRVYNFDKNKRKTRDAYNYDVPRFCEQF